MPSRVLLPDSSLLLLLLLLWLLLFRQDYACDYCCCCSWLLSPLYYQQSTVYCDDCLDHHHPHQYRLLVKFIVVPTNIRCFIFFFDIFYDDDSPLSSISVSDQVCGQSPRFPCRYHNQIHHDYSPNYHWYILILILVVLLSLGTRDTYIGSCGAGPSTPAGSIIRISRIIL